MGKECEAGWGGKWGGGGMGEGEGVKGRGSE